MKIQRPLFWHQGLFLQPQHFQLQDQAAQSGLIPFLNYQGPHFWGVGRAEFDQAALGGGSFHLYSGCFLFPDGSYLEYPGNALLGARSFPGSLGEGKTLQVYLGLRRWDEAGRNVTVIETGEQASATTTRFVTMADPEEVGDLYGQGPAVQVERLQYLLRIFWESELDQLGDYLLIPLARLENRNGAVLSGRFIPPSLALEASAPLQRLVKEIRDHLIGRSRQLELSQRESLHTGVSPHETVQLLAIMALNRQVQYLSHLIEAPSVHPWLAYGSLRQLVGELSAFSAQPEGLGEDEAAQHTLPPYDHQNLWHCFAAAQRLVTKLLDELCSGPDHLIPLLPDGHYYTAELKRSLLEGNRRFYLSLRTQLDSKDVLLSVNSVAKLSAREHLSLLASRALPGLPLKFLDLPPGELPRRPQTLYFAVDQHHEQWAMVAKENNIALYWEDAPADLEVELIVLEKPGQG